MVDARTVPTVMPTKVGIHDLPLAPASKSWMPTSVGMTVVHGPRVKRYAAWYYSALGK
jgi:hypothetical protein